MTTATAPPRSGEPIVLAMLRKGRGLDYIARASGWPETDLRALAERNEIAVVPHDQQTAGPVRPATAAGHPVASASARPGLDRVLDRRVDDALTHPSKRVQAAARKVKDAMDHLDAALRDDEQRNAEKRRIAAEKQAAKAEVERLTAALAEAKAKLRKPRPHGQSSNTATVEGASPAELRAWAKANGVDCPAVGRVPQHIVDKWKAATGK